MVNILFVLIIYILKISFIKDNTLIKGIGSPLLISIDMTFLTKKRKMKNKKMIRLEPGLNYIQSVQKETQTLHDI